jgi:hypothetical protein
VQSDDGGCADVARHDWSCPAHHGPGDGAEAGGLAGRRAFGRGRCFAVRGGIGGTGCVAGCRGFASCRGFAGRGRDGRRLSGGVLKAEGDHRHHSGTHGDGPDR